MYKGMEWGTERSGGNDMKWKLRGKGVKKVERGSENKEKN